MGLPAAGLAVHEHRAVHSVEKVRHERRRGGLVHLRLARRVAEDGVEGELAEAHAGGDGEDASLGLVRAKDAARETEPVGGGES